MQALQFSEGFRQAMLKAQELAHSTRTGFISTYHAAAGLLEANSGLIHDQTAVLKNLHCCYAASKTEQCNDAVDGCKLPASPRVRAAIDYAAAQARHEQTMAICARHLLVGLLRATQESGGLVFDVLTAAGVILSKLCTSRAQAIPGVKVVEVRKPYHYSDPLPLSVQGLPWLAESATVVGPRPATSDEAEQALKQYEAAHGCPPPDGYKPYIFPPGTKFGPWVGESATPEEIEKIRKEFEETTKGMPAGKMVAPPIGMKDDGDCFSLVTKPANPSEVEIAVLRQQMADAKAAGDVTLACILLAEIKRWEKQQDVERVMREMKTQPAGRFKTEAEALSWIDETQGAGFGPPPVDYDHEVNALPTYIEDGTVVYQVDGALKWKSPDVSVQEMLWVFQKHLPKIRPGFKRTSIRVSIRDGQTLQFSIRDVEERS